ncbi:MAG: hypothetical protein K2M91_04040 [Lachnospiraceae bacterium]|nr:hypothetical protein [Lachnospiraceae bacterium]
MPKMCNQAIVGDNRQTNGWISFNNKLQCVDDRKHVAYKNYGPIVIYVPFYKYNEFWRMMQVEFVWGFQDFMLTLRWSDYQQFYEEVDSLYDQIEMAVCIIQNTSVRRSPQQIQLLTEHINKAVRYALKYNQKEHLMFYQANQLLLPEKGLNVRKAIAYAEKYQNTAAIYLMELLNEL